MRATHNLFLKKRLRINNLTGDLGSGGKNDYNKFIFKNLNLVKSFDFYKRNNMVIMEYIIPYMEINNGPTG